MILTGQLRLGRDAEIRYTADGSAVANFNGAYNYGRKGQDGNRPTQWVRCSLWGKQAEALSQWLVKGSAWDVTLNDVHLEEFTKQDGTKNYTLVGRIINIEFGATNRGQDQGQGQQQPTRQQQPQQPQQNQYAQQTGAQTNQQPVQNNPYQAGGAADMDDDIPFAPKHSRNELAF